ncbi:MAG: hypothetical protein K8U03_25085 [Planctomycetia bacterium]|nr:hypothetical protein [Planctomycetia bacterium]
MVADSRPPDPNADPTDDLTLTIYIERPKEGLPEGRISMTSVFVTLGGLKTEAAANGPHEERAMQRVLIDAYSYFRDGRKSFVNRVDRYRHDHGQDR